MNENVPFPNPGSRLLSRLASVDGPDVAALQRVGDTVRRPTHANSDFVARLLTHLEQVGFRATHHYLGIDEQGRAIFTFVSGQTTNHPEQRNEGCYAAVGHLLRELHDSTAGTDLADGQDCVVHGDPGPANVVLQSGMPVAFIDWDQARPGSRIGELAYATWGWCLATIGNIPLRDQLRRLREFRDGYGAGDAEDLLDAIIRAQRAVKEKAEAKLLSARSAEDWDLSHLQTIGWATIEREHVERNAAAIVKALR